MKNKKVNLDDICFFQEGPGVRKHQYCNKGIKLINVSNLVDGEIDLSNSYRYISQEEAYGRYKHFLIDEGDLIIASSGIKVEYLDKKVAFIRKEHLPLCMNTSTIRFKVKNKNELDILYLSYFLKSKNFKNQISKLITGSAQLNFGGSHLKKINLFLPELNVQKKVSTLLLLIDNTIKDMQRKLSILEQLTKSLFTTMFGDIKTNDKNWEIKKLKELVEIKSFIINKNLDSIWLLNLEDIEPNTGKLIKKREVYFKNIPSSTISFNENYILYSKLRPYLNKVFLPDDKGFGTSELVPLLPKKNIHKIFLTEYLRNDKIVDFLSQKVSGAKMPRVIMKEFQDLNLIFPPIELQNKFAERIEKIEKLKFIISAIILKPYKPIKKKGVKKD